MPLKRVRKVSSVCQIECPLDIGENDQCERDWTEGLRPQEVFRCSCPCHPGYASAETQKKAAAVFSDYLKTPVEDT